MIRINQLKLPVTHKTEDLYKKAARQLHIRPEDIRGLHIIKKSVDARKKEELLFIYTVDVETGREEALVKKAADRNISLVKELPYQFPSDGKTPLSHPPVIVGTGPAGLFCGLMLAEAGYRPILLERGDAVEQRIRKVDRFWEMGELDVNSNVQFGEGGAGTFSDGKLNTLVKDPLMRNKKVLEILVEHGADPEILYLNKPHIGTDVLSHVVKNIREHIISLGGEVRFNSQVTDILVAEAEAGAEVEAGSGAKAEAKAKAEAGRTSENISQGGQRVLGVVINGTERVETETLVLAVGHSARDTFSMLQNKGIPMQQKAFAIGVRIQHPQTMINRSQYGMEDAGILGPASYKLTKQTSSGRGVYSFCMCPGGYVVNASSETGRLAVNGMSNHDRGGENANSALIVTVTPEDFGSDAPLAGVEYQRRLEALAYRYGEGKIPIQLYGDFKNNIPSTGFGKVRPAFKGAYQFADLREMLPGYMSEALMEGMEAFDRVIEGFGRPDSILAGIESRTSSPVRIMRDDRFESALAGLFPCGEGAGYAGGITSAAMDGIKVAEEIGRRFKA